MVSGYDVLHWMHVTWGKGRRTLWFFSTTMPPLICALCDDVFTHDATRFVFCPRCFSLAFLFCPERTASVVPMMAGHAAIAVRSPKTMMASFHGTSRMLLMRVNKHNMVYYFEMMGEHPVMIGQHRYRSSLGPELQK